MGIAKPRPIEPPWVPPIVELSERIEELIPITWPDMFTSGPPELPGLIAASVWIAGYVVVWSACGACGACCWRPNGSSCEPWSPSEEATDTARSSALTMPLVTVAPSPNGDPMATTPSPTFRSEDLPISAGVRPVTPWAFTTARSVTGSVPTILALAVVPSLKLTEMEPPSPATAATWLLVRIVPSAVRTTPEPEPASFWPVTLSWTTEGSTLEATPSIGLLDVELFVDEAFVRGLAERSGLPLVEESGWNASYAAA